MAMNDNGMMSDEAMSDDMLDAEGDATGADASVTDEGRKLASSLARAIYMATQKIDGGDAVDPKSAEFKEKWGTERPRMMKIARLVLRRMAGKGYQISAEAQDA